MTNAERRLSDAAELADLDDTLPAGELLERHGPDMGGKDRSVDIDSLTIQDVIDAEDGRPDLPDETSDGLDDGEEAVRRQAEGLPFDTPGRQ